MQRNVAALPPAARSSGNSPLVSHSSAASSLIPSLLGYIHCDVCSWLCYQAWGMSVNPFLSHLAPPPNMELDAGVARLCVFKWKISYFAPSKLSVNSNGEKRFLFPFSACFSWIVGSSDVLISACWARYRWIMGVFLVTFLSFSALEIYYQSWHKFRWPLSGTSFHQQLEPVGLGGYILRNIFLWLLDRLNLDICVWEK